MKRPNPPDELEGMEDDSDFEALFLDFSSCESSSDSEGEDDNDDLDSDSSDDVALPTDWTSRGKERSPFTFHADSGVKFTVEDKENPLEYFEKYFDEELIEYLVTETNRFANDYLDEN